MKFNINEFRFVPCDYFKEESEAMSRGLIFNMQAGLIEQSLHNLNEEDFLKLKNIVEKVFLERWGNGDFRKGNSEVEIAEIEMLTRIQEYIKEK